MEKSYLLLSNNKSSGPYSLDELLQLYLKPTDLVWIENESVTWMNVDEVPEWNDRQKMLDSKSSNASTAAINYGKNDNERSEQKNVFVSLPVLPGESPTSKISLEEKAAELKQKILAAAAEKKQDAISYVRLSPPYLKNGHPTPIKEKAKRQVHLPPFLSYSLLAVLLLVSSFFLLRRPAHKLADNSPQVLYQGKSYSVTSLVVKSPQSAKDSVGMINKSTVTSSPARLAETGNKPFINHVDSPVITNNPIAIKPLTAVEESQRFTSGNPGKTTVALEKTPVTRLFETSSQAFKNEEGIGLIITFQNISEQSIRSAIVDVFYFDTAEKQIGKETLYFAKMLPGTAITKKSTAREGAYASYRVDLVSSEKNGLYVYR